MASQPPNDQYVECVYYLVKTFSHGPQNDMILFPSAKYEYYDVAYVVVKTCWLHNMRYGLQNHLPLLPLVIVIT